MEAKASLPSSTDLWVNYLAKGGSMKALRGIDQKQLEMMYKVAYGRYDSALYNDSLLIFKHLCRFDHREYRFFLGLGVTQVALQQYAQAAATFSYAEKLDHLDPRASLRMAGCFIELKKLNLARQALVVTIDRASRANQWKQELVKAEKLLEYTNMVRE